MTYIFPIICSLKKKRGLLLLLLFNVTFELKVLLSPSLLVAWIWEVTFGSLAPGLTGVLAELIWD